MKWVRKSFVSEIKPHLGIFLLGLKAMKKLKAPVFDLRFLPQ
jgi:hypothetical protein